MDCSELICRVLAADNITDGTKHMNSSLLKTYLQNKQKFTHSKDPKIGDIALWEGHSGVVTGVGKDGTIKLTHARGIGKPVNENPYAILPEKYRSGSDFLGYFRPVVENPDQTDENDVQEVAENQAVSNNEDDIDDKAVYFGSVLKEVVVHATRLEPIKPIGFF
jgi:hypothetical protein